ncbi:hypothetical protein DPMN_070805 [Dreissena polymorpha]|uniref:EF-hand domain-containing protein n=1 Tax=Dreissena polymorpha TaxID=45954 RepID=A0A9D3Z1N5_DREPO|nr:hypothetical protein DPMN_070805 [Dreissena polymorpha]
MFEKGGKNKMAARDLGALLRCLGWNPSERELEEAKHELVVSSRGSVTFAEIERYMARRGGILYGCQDKEDIQEAFQVLDGDGDGKISIRDFRYFMTTMGEKMTDEEVEDMLQSVYKRKHTNFDSIEFHDIIEGLNETTIIDIEVFICIFRILTLTGSSGLMVGRWLRDREVPGSNPALTTGISLSKNLSHICSSPPMCINGYL